MRISSRWAVESAAFGVALRSIALAAAVATLSAGPASGARTESEESARMSAPVGVTFKTDDGVTLAGRLWLSDADRPTVIGLPMFRNKKESYDPVAPLLHDAGLNFLAIDLRGHGASRKEGEDLAARVETRDPEVFNAMHRDVEAAIRWLEATHGIDATRIGLIGASVGCSVAVRTATKNRGQIRALVLMTPGPAYLGVDTLSDLADWDAPPTLILTSSEEEPRVRPVIDAVSAHSTTIVDVIPGQGIHGTRMFGAVEAIEARIARFFRRHLVDGVDLRIPRFADGHPIVETPGFVRRTLRARRADGDALHELMLFGTGDALSLGAMVKQPFDGTVVFHLRPSTGAPARVEVPFQHPRDSRDAPTARVVRGDTTATVDAAGAAAGPWGWVQLEIDCDEWQLDEGFDLAVAFHPAIGEAVFLPSQPRAAALPRRFYRARLTDHALPDGTESAAPSSTSTGGKH